MTALITVLGFATAFLLIFGINLVVADISERERIELRNRLREQMRVEQRELARESQMVQKGLSELAEEAFEEAAASKKGFRERLVELTAQSGLRISPRRLVVTCVCVGLLVGPVGGLLLGSVVGAVLLTLIAGAVPMMYVQMKRQQRLEALRAQLPDCFDLMGRILRSGQTMSQAMQSVAQEFKAPAGLEFGYCYEQQNLGLAPEFAMRDLARRTGLLEIKIFVLAVLVHRQTGGNLTELLDKLSLIVRDRFRLRGKIQSMTAEGRMQGAILLALPIGVYAILLLLNRPYAIKLFDHPILPLTTLICMGIGAMWIRKIVNFDF